MNHSPQGSAADLRRTGQPEPVLAERSLRDEWMHDFRNALGTILVASDATRSLLSHQRNAEVATTIDRIEEGCNRCLRLLRTMPTS